MGKNELNITKWKIYFHREANFTDFLTQNFNSLFVYTSACIVVSIWGQQILTEQQNASFLERKAEMSVADYLGFEGAKIKQDCKIFRPLHCFVFCYHEKIRWWTKSRLKIDFQVSICVHFKRDFLKEMLKFQFGKWILSWICKRWW